MHLTCTHLQGTKIYLFKNYSEKYLPFRKIKYAYTASAYNSWTFRIRKEKNQFNSIFKVELDLRNYLLLKSISVEQMHTVTVVSWF